MLSGTQVNRWSAHTVACQPHGHLSKLMISISSLLVSALAIVSRNSSRLTAAGSVFCMTATTPAHMHFRVAGATRAGCKDTQAAVLA